ncbi:MAG: DUF4358 domain-containing protein [Clostridia bacterium]|nr:DUF4358 domain-containing protein [Clostridia bacterium]
MKHQTLIALILSIIVITITTLLVLFLEPNKAKVPVYHEKTAKEIDKFISTIKKDATSSVNLFGQMTDVDESTLKYVIGVEPTYLEEFSAKVSETDASCYFVFKLKEGSKNLIEQSMLSYMEYLENKWTELDSTQAMNVQNYSKIVIEDDILIFVVSNNNEYIKQVLNPFFYYIGD